MYQIAVRFDIPAEHREEFIAAALEDGRESAAHEPGTRYLDLIVDAEDPNRFHVVEAYDDEAAFRRHLDGPHVARFRERVSAFAGEATWLIRGHRLADPAS